MKDLTKNEKWVVEFLVKEGCFVSPTEIGNTHARQFGFSWSHHSRWASPICLSLVKKGLVERNARGWYRYPALKSTDNLYGIAETVEKG